MKNPLALLQSVTRLMTKRRVYAVAITPSAVQLVGDVTATVHVKTASYTDQPVYMDFVSFRVAVEGANSITLTETTINGCAYKRVESMQLDRFDSSKPALTTPLPALDMLKRVKVAAGVRDVRYYLNSVCFDLAQGVVVATDGWRAHAADNAIKKFTDDELATLRHNNNRPYLTRDDIALLTLMKLDTIAFQDAGKGSVLGYHATGKDVALTGLTGDGTFPDYPRVMPSQSAVRSMAAPDGVAKAMKHRDEAKQSLEFAQSRQDAILTQKRKETLEQAQAALDKARKWATPAYGAYKGMRFAPGAAQALKNYVKAVTAFKPGNVLISVTLDFSLRAVVPEPSAHIRPWAGVALKVPFVPIECEIPDEPSGTLVVHFQAELLADTLEVMPDAVVYARPAGSGSGDALYAYCGDLRAVVMPCRA